MKKYNLLLSIRNIRKNKLFTFINFSGLIIGMTISLLIFKYVQYEFSYDKFHEYGENIYRVRYDTYRDGVEQFKCVGAIPALGPALKADFTEVEEQCRLNPFYDGLIVLRDKNVYRFQDVFFADNSILSMFSFKAISGDVNNALKDVGTAVITENVAKKLFGDTNPIGNQFSIPAGDENIQVTVTAVMENVPDNSHLKFDILFSYSSLVARAGNEAETSWGWYDFYTYIKLADGTDFKKLEAKFPAFVDKHTPNSEREYVLQPLHDIHLTSNYLQEMEANGNKKMVIALGIIGIFILIIAWANYINLSAVVAINRIKEVGVRKTNGASKSQILYQFFSESLIINIVCFTISIFIFNVVLEPFGIFTQKPLTLIPMNFEVWLLLCGFILTGSIISGAIPAFHMSSYNPVKAIKGNIRNEHTLNPRKILVGFQYIISIVLIICTIFIFKQINFIRKYNLGIDIERTLVIQGPSNTNFDNYDQIHPKV